MSTPHTLTPDALLGHEAFVLRLARSLTRDEATARDLTQETLMAAVRSQPEARSVRGWLATVLRHRATHEGRSSARRVDREAEAARPEAQALAPSAPLEQLEMNQSVVEAVLSLEEPYRSVVVGVYYEGMTPKTFASRHNVEASTVRSQLTRALEKLKLKLDARHGERSLWCAPLWTFAMQRGAEQMALPVSSGTAAAKLGSTTAGSAVTPGWMALGVAAAAAVAGTTWVLLQDPESTTPEGVVVAIASESHVADGEALAPLQPGSANLVAGSGAASAVAEPGPGVASSSTLEDIPDLLQRARYLRTEITDRALRIEPELNERFAWLDGDGEVTRILERGPGLSVLSLPWMREGGSYYSFSERVHDFNRRPQVAYETGVLGARRGAGFTVDLGAVPLADVPSTPAWNGPALGTLDSVRFQVAWSGLEGAGGPEDTPETFEDVKGRLLEDAGANGVLSEEKMIELYYQPLDARPDPVVGHSYLLRVRSAGEYNDLFAYEVLDVSPEAVTIAWRELATGVVDGHKDIWVSTMHREDLGPIPEEIRTMDDQALREELDRVLGTAHGVLFEGLPAELVDRFADLHELEGAGLARLTAYAGELSELEKVGVDGHSLSPLDGSRGGRTQCLGLQGSEDRITLHPGLNGGIFGAISDLGALDLDAVSLANVAAYGGPKTRIVLDRAFGANSIELKGMDVTPSDPARAKRNYWHAVKSDLNRRLQGQSLLTTAAALVGHTYLVRTIAEDSKNVLFAVHVAAIDEYGAIVAWKVLESGPAEPVH